MKEVITNNGRFNITEELYESIVSNNPELLTLSCGGNPLGSLDVNNNTKLEELFCTSNQLTVLNLNNNTLLKRLGCSNNLLSSLDISNCPLLKEVSCYNNPYLTEIWLKAGQEIGWFQYDSSVATIYYK